MSYSNYSKLRGVDSHAILSPSQGAWLGYSEDKLKAFYEGKKAVIMGTRLHEYAAEAISLRRRQSTEKKAINRYINDAIGYAMKPEQRLIYSSACFGTADAISFNNGVLQIFDLKTGKNEAGFRQLDIYAALYCLQYGIDPRKIKIEERVYQHKDFKVNEPDPNYILEVMNTIELFSSLLIKWDEEDDHLLGLDY